MDELMKLFLTPVIAVFVLGSVISFLTYRRFFVEFTARQREREARAAERIAREQERSQREQEHQLRMQLMEAQLKKLHTPLSSTERKEKYLDLDGIVQS